MPLSPSVTLLTKLKGLIALPRELLETVPIELLEKLEESLASIKEVVEKYQYQCDDCERFFDDEHVQEVRCSEASLLCHGCCRARGIEVEEDGEDEDCGCEECRECEPCCEDCGEWECCECKEEEELKAKLKEYERRRQLGYNAYVESWNDNKHYKGVAPLMTADEWLAHIRLRTSHFG